ncbi:MAG: hypothetical protein M0P77_10825 [Firmicutes bacterium]|nr:hypothetical protein [Bacillota bacterium]
MLSYKDGKLIIDFKSMKTDLGQYLLMEIENFCDEKSTKTLARQGF